MNNPNTENANGPSLQVLYVTIDSFASQVPIRFLNSGACDVTMAGSGEEAWSLVEAGDVRFDVVMADHDTQRADGMGSIGLVTKLRSVRHRAAIILLVDTTCPAEWRSYETLGVKWIMKKPVELWEWQQTLEIR